MEKLLKNITQLPKTMCVSKYVQILIAGLFIIVIFLIVNTVSSNVSNNFSPKKTRFWNFQSIDTMKYSRDLSREKLHDESFDDVIEVQIKAIADTGATHVGIATPYDKEFLPILKRWVYTARKHHLKIWFRGNWSGWEKWFSYPSIDRTTHTKKTEEFILTHADLFEDGDIFSACPECENGGPGDPRRNGDVIGHRKFLVDEYNVTKNAFLKIGKEVASNYAAMNADVAFLVMDPDTTRKLDGIVVIDHYVTSAEKLNSDITNLAKYSGGKVVLGEFGAPIPDLHGSMTERQQATWLNEALSYLHKNPALVGVNYWINIGGSSELWNKDNNPKQGVSILTRYFKPKNYDGVLVGQAKENINNAVFLIDNNLASSSDNTFRILYVDDFTATISAEGYVSTKITQSTQPNTIRLSKKDPNMLYKLRIAMSNIFRSTSK